MFLLVYNVCTASSYKIRNTLTFLQYTAVFKFSLQKGVKITAALWVALLLDGGVLLLLQQGKQI